MPEFVAKRPARYRGKRLKDLCGEMHAFFRDARRQPTAEGAIRRQASAGDGHDAARGRRAIWCATMSITCRSTSSTAGSRRRLFVVYPPGIATIVPGERLTERARPMIDYLKMFEKSANVFPGFEAEIQGLYREVDASGRDSVLYLCGPGVME